MPKLEDLVEPGDIVTTRDQHRYKVYIEPKGLYLESMEIPRQFLDFKNYDENLDHVGWSDKDVVELFNPRTRKGVLRPE